MGNVFYLIAIIVGVSGQSILKKPYTQKNGGNGVYFFIALVSAAAMAFFAVTSSKLQFNSAFLPYAVGFAAAYAISSIFGVLAIACGSLSLTSLFSSYSLLIPTVYGLVFLGDPVGAGLIPGLVLLMLSLFLINKADGKARLSVKWLICVAVSFAGSGMCSVVQKMQQVAFDGAYKNEFMIVALAIVTVVMLVMSLWKERKGIRQYAVTGWYWAILCGALNGMVNLFVMILSGRMPVSLMFPGICAGGLVLTYLASKFIYKEALTKTQFVGFLLGSAAIIFLNF